ncbi:MAG TPA: DUF1697 domain-containing protein [Solirubrobacteraceae bacterium]|nr:DUF1697 domain-containing protein [Solirubrobacteraceae bacterium]
MADFAAFLKGINLGKRRITNDDLRGHFEAIGLSGAAVFRASGNVVFDDPEERSAAELTTLIEADLERLLGYTVAVFLRGREEMLEIAHAKPFDAATTRRLKGKLQVVMLGEKPKAAAKKTVLGLSGKADALAFGTRELFWLPAGGISDSKLEWKAIERALGATTTRTMGTVEQIAAKHFSA